MKPRREAQPDCMRFGNGPPVLSFPDRIQFVAIIVTQSDKDCSRIVSNSDENHRLFRRIRTRPPNHTRITLRQRSVIRACQSAGTRFTRGLTNNQN